MRALGLIDVLTAARALMAVPSCEWAELARVLMSRAHEADACRLKTGRAHVRFGNGTLEGAARGFILAKEASLGSAEFRRALTAVLMAVEDCTNALPACARNALGHRRIEVQPFE